MKRARGKPKGHKDTRTARVVVSTDDLHRAGAELEFLRAVNARLPVEAFDDLSQIAPERVEDWTTQWRIHCPCVLEAARSLASLAQTWREDAGEEIPQHLRSLLRRFGESYRGVPPPDLWLKEQARLYRLPPVEPTARRAIALESELHQQELDLDALDVPALNPPLIKTPAGKQKGQADRVHALVHRLVQEAKSDMWRARAKALERDEALAPPLTDGMESLQEYLIVASAYWTAVRARFLKIVGDTKIKVYVVRPIPNLARDARWLARCRLHHKIHPATDLNAQLATIAKEEKVTVRAVEKAIRQFARRIRLPFHHRLGRPRKSTVR